MSSTSCPNDPLSTTFPIKRETQQSRMLSMKPKHRDKKEKCDPPNNNFQPRVVISLLDDDDDDDEKPQAKMQMMPRGKNRNDENGETSTITTTTASHGRDAAAAAASTTSLLASPPGIPPNQSISSSESQSRPSSRPRAETTHVPDPQDATFVQNANTKPSTTTTKQHPPPPAAALAAAAATTTVATTAIESSKDHCRKRPPSPDDSTSDRRDAASERESMDYPKQKKPKFNNNLYHNRIGTDTSTDTKNVDPNPLRRPRRSDYEKYLQNRNERFLQFSMPNNNGNNNNVSHATQQQQQKQTGFWQGNGIDRDRVIRFIRCQPVQCGSCLACQATRCHRCTLCLFGTDDENHPPRACVFRCCRKNHKHQVRVYLKELADMLARNDRCLRVGDRVHCRYTNNRWYWGMITQTYPYRKEECRFSILYDDGDRRKNVPEIDILTEFEVDIANEETYLQDQEHGYIIRFPNADENETEDEDSANGKSSSFDSNDSVEDSSIPANVLVPSKPDSRNCCGKCSLCQREKCHQCAACLDATTHSSSTTESHACFQKMCLALPLSTKAKEAPGIPSGWKFAFVEKAPNPSVSDQLKGLRLISPTGKAFFSVERAMRLYRTDSSKSLFDPAVFYRFVGLSGVVDGEKINGERARNALQLKRILSSKKKLHARVFARFTNGEFYWGSIAEISGTKEHPTYKIHFEDGDALDGLDENDLYTEKDFKLYYKIDPPDPSNNNSDPMSPVDLFLKRCKSCSMCTRKDCGKCESCMNNQTSCPYRYACFRNMCLHIGEELKAQNCPGVPGWKFFFVEDDEPSVIRLQADLVGLRFVSHSGDIEYNMENVLKKCHFSKDVVENRLRDFYENHLGIYIRSEIEEHVLLGKPWYNEWIDVHRRSREIWGTITHAWWDVTGDQIFRVDYNPSLRAEAHIISGEFGDLPAFDDQVSAEDAWGGYVAALEQQQIAHRDHTPICRSIDVPFMIRRVRPSSLLVLKNTPYLPVRQMIFAGFSLSLEARDSNIPNAGLGLWLTILPLWPNDDRLFLELDPGVLVDFGVYAPLLPSDRKSDKISLVKNFLYDWDPEGWNFEMAMHGKSGHFDIFDISDDLSGKLHSIAEKNIICYVNETDGKETPNVVGLHDPEGAIHYFLGHRFKDQGPLKLPSDGTPVELKIDYGPKYEKCRVRKGYPRVGKTELNKLRKLVARDDEETIQELDHFSANDILDCIEFLEGILNSESWRPSIHTLERFLTLALAIHFRCKSIGQKFYGFDITDTESFCNHGFTDMEKNRTLNRAKAIVLRVYALFEDGKQLPKSLNSMRLLRRCFAVSIGKPQSEIDQMSLDEICESLMTILRVDCSSLS